jgi:uncharacterized protein (UPF0216 family)
MSADQKVIEHMVSELNTNMPVNRRTLSDYLENGNYTYKTRSGVLGTLDRAELEQIASICTDFEKNMLKVPIFVSADTGSERSAWKIEGKTEVAVMSKMLEKRIHTDDFLQIYYPDLQKMKNLIPNSIFMLFLP